MINSRLHGRRCGGAGRPRGEETKVVRLPIPVARLAQRFAAGTISARELNGFLDVEAVTHMTVPLMGSSASCGFPSPADDYIDRALEFNELIIRNPPATFAVVAKGDSMIKVGLFPTDVVVVDRSLTAVHESIVLALLDNEFTIKRLWLKGGRMVLHPENDTYPDIIIDDGRDFEVWGVVTTWIRRP